MPCSPKAESLDLIIMTLDREVGFEVPGELHYVSHPHALVEKPPFAGSRDPFKPIQVDHSRVTPG